jgi:hypothetical protein
MSNDNVAPINHSAGSAVATTAASTAGGVISGGFKAAIGWIGAWGAIGTVLGVVGAIAMGGVIAGPIALGIVGGVAGTGFGVVTSTWAGAVGALFGGFKGAERGANRVSEERGQAAALQAQVEVAKAQAPVYAPYAAQGSPMNPASTQINVGRDAQYDGPINGQLALAR